jgi:hypothetical protein
MDTVFVVIRSDGEYSDRYETVLGYFTDEGSAQRFCTEAEREWKNAVESYPEPPYGRHWWFHDDYDMVYPDRHISTHNGSFGSVTIVTPDYSAPAKKVMVSEEEKAKRIAVRGNYSRALANCRAQRLSIVTLDKGGNPDSSWHYELAEPLSDSDTRPQDGDSEAAPLASSAGR